APTPVPQGVLSETTPPTTTRVSALKRLRTPAPKSEKAGYIAIIVLLAVDVVGFGWGLGEGVATGHLRARPGPRHRTPSTDISAHARSYLRFRTGLTTDTARCRRMTRRSAGG